MNMNKNAIKLKTILQLSVTLVVLGILLLFLYGWLPPKEKYIPNIIAESEHWTLVSDSGDFTYLSYRQENGGAQQEEMSPYLCGIGLYSIAHDSADPGNEVQINEYPEMGRTHLGPDDILGENIWLVMQIESGPEIEAACLDVLWKENENAYVERLCSTNLSKQQIEHIEEYIAMQEHPQAKH